MKTEIEWFDVNEQPLMQGFDDVMLCDVLGNIYFGYRDDHGYQKGHTYSFGCDEIQDVVYWAYKPKTPVSLNKCFITNDDWVTLAAKQGLLKE